MISATMSGQPRKADVARGVALLAVLWLTMALSLIAFSTAYVVRTEAAATSNQLEIQRAYFMARGGIDRSVFEILRSLRSIPVDEMSSAPDRYQPGRRWLEFSYTEGRAVVQVVPENAKLSINSASIESLQRLFEANGRSSDESASLARAIFDWRSSKSSVQETAYDQYYDAMPVPIVPSHSAMNDVEEVMYVKGMTREFFFGGAPRRAEEPASTRSHSLLDVLTAQPAGPVNLNYATAEVMATLPGWDRALANLVADGRRDDEFISRPYRTMDELVRRVPSVVNVLGVSSVTLNAGDTFTLIATGQLNQSKLVRTVRALIRLDSSRPAGYLVLGWWDDWPWSSPPDEILRSNFRQS